MEMLRWVTVLLRFTGSNGFKASRAGRAGMH